METDAVQRLAKEMASDLFGVPRWRMEIERAVSSLDADIRKAFLVGFDLGVTAERRGRELAS